MGPGCELHEPPRSVILEPHCYCNLTCVSCLTGQGQLRRARGRMAFAPFQRLVDEISSWVKYVHWSGMGEPLLYEDSLDYLAYLSGAGIRVRVDTNGHCFRDGRFVERLIRTGPAELNIALDGADQASLAAIGGANADFERLVEGIRTVIETRNRLESDLKVNLQFIVSKPNEGHASEVWELGRSLDPDSMTFKLIRLDPNDEHACRVLMPDTPSYREYEMDSSGKWQLKGEMHSACWAIRDYCVVWWDGTLLPCCFDLSGKYAYGNVFETSFREAWNSDAAVAFRETATRDLPSIPMCGICPVARDQDNCWERELR